MRFPVSFLFGLWMIIVTIVEGNTKSYNPQLLCLKSIADCRRLRAPLNVVTSHNWKMYTKAEDLEHICRNEKQFISCMKNAKKVCSREPHSHREEAALKVRGFAEDLCENSTLQKVYLEISNCINSHLPESEDCSVLGMLINKTPASMCRWQMMFRNCQIETISRKCGDIAADIRERLIKFDLGLDLSCYDFEEKQKNKIKFPPLLSLSAYKGAFKSIANQFSRIIILFKNMKELLKRGSHDTEDSLTKIVSSLEDVLIDNSNKYPYTDQNPKEELREDITSAEASLTGSSKRVDASFSSKPSTRQEFFTTTETSLGTDSYPNEMDAIKFGSEASKVDEFFTTTETSLGTDSYPNEMDAIKLSSEASKVDEFFTTTETSLGTDSYPKEMDAIKLSSAASRVDEFFTTTEISLGTDSYPNEINAIKLSSEASKGDEFFTTTETSLGTDSYPNEMDAIKLNYEPLTIQEFPTATETLVTDSVPYEMGSIASAPEFLTKNTPVELSLIKILMRSIDDILATTGVILRFVSTLNCEYSSSDEVLSNREASFSDMNFDNNLTSNTRLRDTDSTFSENRCMAKESSCGKVYSDSPLSHTYIGVASAECIEPKDFKSTAEMYKKKGDTILSTQNGNSYVSINITIFDLYEVFDQGKLNYLGCGRATILWEKDYPLTDVYCTAMNMGTLKSLFKCTIRIDDDCLYKKGNKNVKDLFSPKMKLVVYGLEDNEMSMKKRATIEIEYFKPNDMFFSTRNVPGCDPSKINEARNNHRLRRVKGYEVRAEKTCGSTAASEGKKYDSITSTKYLHGAKSHFVLHQESEEFCSGDRSAHAIKEGRKLLGTALKHFVLSLVPPLRWSRSLFSASTSDLDGTEHHENFPQRIRNYGLIRNPYRPHYKSKTTDKTGLEISSKMLQTYFVKASVKIEAAIPVDPDAYH
ncbi:hypothetical protein NPIL_595471 [Nephila pilipes]|uniref:Uncharacterized protein n=1 Tax=Nephila pilipes TaxID=299642 RepID=A0A8X6N0W2_NEPPI|nr:hypothetical protein NPIL_595471 [Nephila pilipes]